MTITIKTLEPARFTIKHKMNFSSHLFKKYLFFHYYRRSLVHSIRQLDEKYIEKETKYKKIFFYIWFLALKINKMIMKFF